MHANYRIKTAIRKFAKNFTHLAHFSPDLRTTSTRRRPRKCAMHANYRIKTAIRKFAKKFTHLTTFSPTLHTICTRRLSGKAVMHTNYRIKTAIREICKEFHAPGAFFARLAYHKYAAPSEKMCHAHKLSHKNSDTGNLQRICGFFTTAKTTNI